MRLLSFSMLVIAAAIVAALVTKIIGHHTTCTTRPGADVFAGGPSISCRRTTGLW